jgi:hypothetical protein
MPFSIRSRILGLLALLCFAFILQDVGAQTLNITPNTVEEISASATTREFHPLADLLFLYRASTDGFEVQRKDTRRKIWGGDIDSVTVTGATTKADKLEKLRYKCFEATTTGGYRIFISRPNVNFKYTTSSKKLELFHVDNGQPQWFGNIDSFHVAGISTVTAKLTYLRSTQGRPTFEELVARGDSATVAAGAAAGTSPTVAVAGNAVSGTVTLTTGSSPTTTGVIFTVTLPLAAPNGYRILGITAKDSDSGAHYNRIFWTTTGSTLVANASGTALSGSTEYIIDYALVAH